jgi:DNA repair protein RadC
VSFFDRRAADIGARALTPTHNDSGHIMLTIIRPVTHASQDDIAITARLKACGDLLGVELLDALVIGDEGRFTSLCELDRC